jgi:hypothetical protein
MFNGAWHRILHDQTAESMAREIARLPHANVTTVPFHFDEPAAVTDAKPATNGNGNGTNGNGGGNGKAPRSRIVLGGGDALVADCRDNGTTPIDSVRWRQQVCIHGRVQAVPVRLSPKPGPRKCAGRRTKAGRGVGVRVRRPAPRIEGVEIWHHLTGICT